MRYIFVKWIKIGPLISHIFRITNHQSLFLLKTSIYIQIVIRWASIHRLSICIIDLPTTAEKLLLSCSNSSLLECSPPTVEARFRVFFISSPLFAFLLKISPTFLLLYILYYCHSLLFCFNQS